jgi:putative endonuclease
VADRRRRLGQTGEELATRFLAGRGYTLVARNVRLAGGEIDIVARDGDCLVFIEVRTRRGGGFGSPEESITPAKAQRLIGLVDAFRQARADEPLPADSRIDLVAVELDARGRLIRVDLVKNAVEGR